ncbi:hypothetical protein GCM10017752_06790 [Streptomyces roseoviridis]
MSHRDPAGKAPDGRPAAQAAAPPDLNLLRTFLAVYRSGSFTAAAHALGLSQPTVTTHIRNLERDTRRDLFERLPRGVAPTPVADELAARIAPALDALAVAAGPGPAGGGRAEPVHLAGPAELLATRVLPALAGLVAEGVRLRVTAGLTDPLLDELRAGRHDLVIATSRPRGRSLVWAPLTDEEFVLVAAPVWAERIREPLAAEGPGVLRAVPLVAYAEDLPIVRRYWRHVFGTRLNGRAARDSACCRATCARPNCVREHWSSWPIPRTPRSTRGTSCSAPASSRTRMPSACAPCCSRPAAPSEDGASPVPGHLGYGHPRRTALASDAIIQLID